MPIEVSPAPFRRSMQLPYTPMFIPEHASQAISGISNGPSVTAANSVIPPNPGGVACPNYAIPALAEAGYAAPSIRPAVMMLDEGRDEQAYRSRSVVHDFPAGGSVYEPRSGPPPLDQAKGDRPHLQSDQHGCVPASLPAPKAAPHLHTSEHPITPSRHHTTSNAQHHHQHHQDHQDRQDSDAMSDTSYYARPKFHRHRTTSVVSGGSFGPREESRHRRIGSMGHGAKPEQHRGHRRSASLLHTSKSVVSPSLPSPAVVPSAPPHRQEQERCESRTHHHRHQSSSRLYPPNAPTESVIAPRRRSQSHSHSHTPAMSAARHPSANQGADHSPLADMPHRNKPDPYRRRATSMQPNQVFGHTPSVAGRGEDPYEDGASVAASSMTFMDAPVAHTTSQYGMPKYAHQMKPDYRRLGGVRVGDLTGPVEE